MRKLFTFLCAALMSASMFALTPREGDTWDEGTKTLTVNSNLPEDAYRYQDEIQHVIINNGVTSIGVDAFTLCTGLKSVSIGNSVESIGYGAFYNCFGLTSVTCVRATPANLGNDVFHQTHANLKIYVPAGSVADYKDAWIAYAAKIKAIPPAWVRDGDEWDYATKTLTVNSDLPYDAYKDQTVIEHVIISSGVTSIGFSAFWKCTGLTSVTIGNSVEYIGSQAFAGCSGLTSVTIGNSVTSIGTQAFGDCTSLEKVTILAESLEWYGLLTFQVTPAALKIYVPAGSVNTYKAGWPDYADKIKAIPPAWVRDGDEWDDATKTLTVNSNLPEEAYKDQTVIERVIISNSVTSIGNGAFFGCTGLTSIVVDAENPNYSSEGGVLFNKAKTTLLQCPGGKQGKYTIPNSVTSIGVGAFAGCSGLISVTINAQSLESYGTNAFQGTAEGLKIYVPAGSVNTYKAAWSDYADKIEAIVVEGVKIGDLYYNLKNDNKTAEVTSNPSKYSGGITIPATVTYNAQNYSVTSIGGSAFFGCTGLTSITIPTSVTSIGNSAFYNCTGLTSIEIPNSVTSIGEEAFAYCTGLTSVTIPNSVTSIGGSAFDHCTGLTSIEIPNSVTSIGDYTFAGSGLTSIEIPNSVTSIGQSAFQSCSGLTSIEIPNSVTSIGMYAFDGDTGLKSVSIGNSVTSIGYGAFFGCTGLTSIEIPNSVTSIGIYAFSGCTALASFTINATTPPTLGTDAFYSTAAALTIYVPAGSVDTYKAAWSAYEDKIEAIPATYTVTANLANGVYWATFYSNAGNYQAPDGTQVFAVNLTGTAIEMTEISDRIVKSGEGVVLKKTTTGSITMTLDTETTPTGDFSSNSLTGTMNSITNPGNAYVLNNGTQGVGFYKLKSTGTIGANKAYLTYSGVGAAAAHGFFLFNETTGIEIPTAESNDFDGTVYDLQGRRVQNPTKGLYIVNGKKVVIK